MARPDLRAALHTTAPVAMGYVPLGAAYGFVLVQAGIDWWWAPISSVVVFAGAMQFVSIPLLAAGAPLTEIALATLVVNFRHVFYALSFPMNALTGFWRRAYGAFALTDETYSLITATPAEQLTPARLTLVGALNHGWWVLGTVVGVALSSGLADGVPGIEFALTALFVVLAQEHLYNRRNVPFGVLGAAAGLCGFLVPDQFLLVAFIAFLLLTTATIRLRGDGAAAEPVEAGGPGDDGGMP